ncbi:protein B4 [Lethenteron reissneri]|uniref:protein B4 n=1 Tax=Lethenteron reissneri TaxID=7753 RepID=UPI002AB73D9A|nr:protein B4 [Lethenteron reissneri]
MVGFPKDIADPENAQPPKTTTTTTTAKSGTVKPGPVQALANLQKATKPPDTLTMAVDAVRELAGRKGASVIAIRSHVVSCHPDVDQVRLKRLLKNALAKGLATGVLVRPGGVNPEISSAVGRYKLGKPVATKVKKLKAAVDGNVEEALVEAQAGATKKAKAPKAAKASAAVKVDASATERAKKPKVDAKLEATASSSDSLTNATKAKPAKLKTTIVEKKKVVKKRTSLAVLKLGSKNAGKEAELNAKAPRAKKTTAKRGAKVLPAAVETGGDAAGDDDDESHGTKAKVPKKTKPTVMKTARVKVVKIDADEAKVKKPRAVAPKKEAAPKKVKVERKPAA